MKLFSRCLVAFSLFNSYCFAGILKVNDDRIINGNDVAGSRAVGYLASLIKNGEHFCSGFIYNNKSIITAASCVEGKLASDVRVMINQYSLINPDPGEEEIPVFKITIKEDYKNDTKFNDIAILQLSKELILVSFSGDSNLPPGPNCLKYEEVLPSQQIYPASFYGWGATEANGFSVQKLRSGKVTISPNDLCVSHYGADYQSSIMICGTNVEGATQLKTGPCNFDEGGPIVVGDRIAGEQVALGIYSKNKDCDVNIPSVYTRLSVYYAWIYQVAGPEPNFNCFNGP